jgi:hypothetical protein
MMDEKLVQCLLDSANIVGIVGDNIHPLIASQNEQDPYIVFTNTSNTYTNSLNCDIEEESHRYQIDCYSKVHKDIKAMNVYLKDAFNVCTFFKTVIMSSFDSVEDGGEWFRVSMDISVFSEPYAPIVYLTDVNGNILTDELGNQLTT